MSNSASVLLSVLDGRGVEARAMIGTGSGAVVVGGVVAAVTEPLGVGQGSWLAAYLVLVVGVAQVAMGLACRLSEQALRSPRRGWAQFWCWNTGNAAVIVGTLIGAPWMVGLGSAVLVPVLALAWAGVKAASEPIIPRPLLVAYRTVLFILAVSIPIGIFLSYLRHR